MGTQAVSWMESNTMDKATKAEEHLSNGAVEKPMLTFELVSQYFCMPIHRAARELNMGQTALKKRCRELGIIRWPGRKVKSLQKLIDDIQELEIPERAENTRMVVQMLQQRKKLMEERPDVELDKQTKVFRQGIYKAKYMIRKRERENSVRLFMHGGDAQHALP